jgi:hypothetical protein
MPIRSPMPALAVLVTAACIAHAATPVAPAAPAAPTAAPLVSGWSLLKEGAAQGTVEIDAQHATNPNPHLLKIAITSYPDPGKATPDIGRLGLKNSTPIPVKEGQYYDITFGGLSEGIGVGLVVSLETDDGAVLARTTLPEIGRGGGGGRGRGRGAPAASAPVSAPATSPATNPVASSPVPPTLWTRYLVSLHARASAPNAHLTVTAIEPVAVWIENLTIVERQPAK